MRICIIGLLVASLITTTVVATERPTKPNLILLLCDNLGYGDVACFGSLKHRTPNIDRMATEGIQLTSFYSASGVCTPSRASLLTGCYPRRVGLDRTEPDGAVLRPVSPNGLAVEEITIAEILQDAGYTTTCIGKWHLGDQSNFLPTRQGFDHYFGIPYSDDMTPRPGRNWPPLPLMRNDAVVEAPVDRNALTRRYTEEAIKFITQNQHRPFFLYLPHAMPGSTKSPFASSDFHGKSSNGPYGDSVEEIDWSTGEILRTLKSLDLDAQTLVIWTSDNGAPRRDPPQGVNKPLGGWGYTTMEGGMRVPCIARWPETIPAGKTSDELATMMDLLPTFANLAGTAPPDDRVIDGRDIFPLLSDSATAKTPHEAFYYYYMDQLQAVRSGPWKLHLALSERRTNLRNATTDTNARLFNLEDDIGETNNVATQHPSVVARLTRLAQWARQDLGDRGRPGQNQRPVGKAPDPKPQILKR